MAVSVVSNAQRTRSVAVEVRWYALSDVGLEGYS